MFGVKKVKERMNQLEKEMEEHKKELDERLDERIETIEEDMNKELEEYEREIKEQYQELEEYVDEVKEEMDRRVEKEHVSKSLCRMLGLNEEGEIEDYDFDEMDTAEIADKKASQREEKLLEEINETAYAVGTYMAACKLKPGCSKEEKKEMRKTKNELSKKYNITEGYKARELSCDYFKIKFDGMGKEFRWEDIEDIYFRERELTSRRIAHLFDEEDKEERKKELKKSTLVGYLNGIRSDLDSYQKIYNCSFKSLAESIKEEEEMHKDKPVKEALDKIIEEDEKGIVSQCYRDVFGGAETEG